METHTFYCPKCGRELTVPFDTDAFCCTYCAAPLKMENGTLHAGLTGSLPQPDSVRSAVFWVQNSAGLRLRCLRQAFWQT